MAEYSVAKNITEHEQVIKEFQKNIPKNREQWKPPIGYMLQASSYHHSRKGRNHGEVACRVGASEIIEGVKWRAIAKAKSRWNFNAYSRNYKVYTTILWAKEDKSE